MSGKNIKNKLNINNKSIKKRKVTEKAFNWSSNDNKQTNKLNKENKIDDDIVSDDNQSDEENELNETSNDHYETKEDMNETANEKRIRLAKEYLKQITNEEEMNQLSDNDNHTNYDNNTNENDLNEMNQIGVTGIQKKIASRLEKEALEEAGKLYKTIANTLKEFEFDDESCKILKGHRLSTTSVCIGPDLKYIYSAAKDGTICKWELKTFTKTYFSYPKDTEIFKLKDHERTILSLAISSDGTYLASGGCERMLRIWNPNTLNHLEVFKGHRDTISCLCFQRNSHMLFSGSFDRTVKHWNLTEMCYIETLYGHQSDINGMDSSLKERIITCGKDRTVRYWKIPEETQLVFNGSNGSIDCIKMINDDYFITGTDNGSIILWFTQKKKPIYIVENAHGKGNWISSLGHLKNTDLIASGSCDGFIKLWQIDLENRCIIQVNQIPINGYINDISFAKQGQFMVAGIGKEHKFGRWNHIKDGINGIAIVALPNLNEL